MSTKNMFYTTLGKKFNNPNALYVELTFDAVPAFSKSIAPLLYDKKFALGLRLDDGLYNAFTNVFAVLYGGIADEQNNVHSGIRSTDGCGNDIVWSGDFALPIYNEIGIDVHSDELSISYIRWSTLRFARDMGFGVVYHGYEKPPIVSNISQIADINERHTAIMLDLNNWKTRIQSELGIKPLVACTPSAISDWFSIGPLSDGSYRSPQFNAGFWTSCSKLSNFLFANVPYTLDLTGLNLDNISNSFFNSPNAYPQMYHYYGTSIPNETIDGLKSQITALHDSPYHLAKAFSTHDVVYNPIANNGNMKFSDFLNLVNWVDANYGKTSGLDEVLFTSMQSVLEYTYCKLNTTINEYREANKVILEIIPPAFPDMRRPALTFKINSDIPVKNISIHNINKFSQNIINHKSGIINVEWSSEFYAAADRFVTKLESTQIPQDKDYAQYLTNMITVTDLKNTLQARINAVTIITSTTWLFDFGTNTTTYPSDYPYNNITSVTPNTYTNLIADNINPTAISLVVPSGCVTGTSANYPSITAGRVANDGYFRDTAFRDYFLIAQASPVIFQITGLNNSKKYDFALMCNRASTTKTTKYTIYNDAAVPFSANSTCLSRNPLALNANFDNPSLITNAIPNNGILYLKIEGVATDGILNAMKITEHD